MEHSHTPPRLTRRRHGIALLGAFVLAGLLAGAPAPAAEPSPPVRIGLTAEFGVKDSHAAQSIEKGILLAIDEINAAGGVLGGRKLALETRDDRGLPARGVDNYIDMAAVPDLVAVFCGRFSPVALEIAKVAGRYALPLLDPWSAADPITVGQAGQPNYAFRLSLTDTWAMQTILDHARSRKMTRLALFVPNTAWGRSNEAALLAYEKARPGFTHETFWYNWGDTDFRERIAQARARKAQAILMVANEQEGLFIVRQLAELPASERLPVIAHWGILGGDFGTTTREYLDKVDLSVVHTFSFSDATGARAKAVANGIQRRFGIEAEALRAQVGFAHAYDLTHLLALAIDKAGSTDRTAIRKALEQLGPYDGLVRRYTRPFTAERHEALERSDVRIGKFTHSGSLKSIGKP